jgi:hypothetical protein
VPANKVRQTLVHQTILRPATSVGNSVPAQRHGVTARVGRHGVLSEWCWTPSPSHPCSSYPLPYELVVFTNITYVVYMRHQFATR